MCWANAQCVAFTYSRSSCFLKTNTKTGDPDKAGHMSGVVPGRSPSPPAPPSTGAQIEDVIVAVGAVNKNTIVSAAVPGQILTNWRDSVDAILCAFLPGEQYGNAIADIIFGDVMPQAKTPLSFPNVANEQKMTTEQYPGLKNSEFGLQNNYTEKQIVGYRWYDKHKVKPAFAFGHGLTYGGMTYSDLKVSGRTVSFSVQGTGCDTPQVYISYPSAKTDPNVPVKVLRFFKKVCATDASVVTSLSYTFTDQDVSNWDVMSKKWTVTSGDYFVNVGSSSQDLRLGSSMSILPGK